MNKFIAFIATSLFVFCPTAYSHGPVNNDPIHISFVNPDSEGNAFWDLFTDVMSHSAKDLGIELSVLYSEKKDRFEYMDLVEKALKSEPKPDYLITIIKRHSTEKLVKLATASNVPLFTVNTGVNPEELTLVKQPRERYKKWIGQMLPDDQHAGYLLARTLMDRVQQDSTQALDKIKVIALSGSRDSTAAIDRNLGLKRALEDNPTAELTQLVFTDWTFENAASKASVLLDRYPNTHVVWAASDNIALGAHEAIRNLDKLSGKTILAGGIDWSKEGLTAVTETKITASVGGHFIEGAMALVLLHDHFHGQDFENELGTQIRTPYSVITDKSDGKVSEFIMRRKWSEVDFTRLSKVHNESLPSYNLSIDALIE